MNRKYWVCIFPFLLLLFAGIGETLQIPPQPNQWVNDYAGILSPAARTELNERLKRFETDTSNQVLVAIFPSLEDESVEDFSNRLFEAWKIGQKKNNNGVLLIVFSQDRKLRIEVGYGLEGALTDAVSSRIIREEIAPEFRAGNYDAGIRKGIDAIEKATRGEYKAAPKSGTSDRISPAMVFFLIVIAFLIFRSIMRRGSSGVFIPDPRFRRRRRNPYDDWWIGGFGGGGGGWSGGGGFDGGGGGGFSGGGGMSGGGGASGSW